MKLPLSKLLSVKLKYTFLQNGSIYWQRKIPKDLQPRYGSAAPLKINLETTDWRIAARKVHRLNEEHESLWESMRGNPDLQPRQIQEAAKGLLQQYQLKPYPIPNDDEALFRFADSLEEKAIRYAEGDENVYRETLPEEYLTPTEVEAIRLLKEQSKPLLSSALDVYLNNHRRGNDEDFRITNERVWKKLISIIGDKPIENLRREDATNYRNRLISEGLKTGTVRRRLNTASAIFNSALKELEIHRLNPFEGVQITGEGEDADQGQPLDLKQLKTLKAAVANKDDSMRWAVALQMDLGTRLAEVIGLTLDDLKLGFLKAPTKDRLEYMTFLLDDWLRNAPKYSLDKANITYEITPTCSDFSPLFPKEHYDEVREQERAELRESSERYNEVVRQLHEVSQRKSHKKEPPIVFYSFPKVDLDAVFDSPKVETEENKETSQEDEAETRENFRATKQVSQYLPVHELDYNGLKLPYVVHEGEPWMLAEKTLAAFGVGFHWLKPGRAPVGNENRRRDLNVEGIKRPTLITVEGLAMVSKRVGFGIEGLKELLLSQPLVTQPSPT